MPKSTKRKIFNSFSELLKTYELDKITVTMLVAECGISRQTFYYHFTNIQALINWGIMKSTAGCLEEAKSAKNITEATAFYLTDIEKNRFFLTKCIYSSLSGYVIVLIKNSIMEYISDFCCKIMKIKVSEQNDSEFIIEFIANAINGFIVSSLYQKTGMDIDDMAEKISRTILGKFSV